jgi:small subunit ribosomal protein S8
MSATDPIADMLTVIRNGLSASKPAVTVPHSRIKTGICQVLKDEGYIGPFDVLDTKPAKTIKIQLKYGPTGQPVIQELVRTSTPGKRTYAATTAIKPIIRGFGISIISTSRGILSDRACRQQRIGGEVLCIVK